MSGVVFMVCVPSEAKEMDFYRFETRKIVIENGNFDERKSDFYHKTGKKIVNEFNTFNHIPMITILEDILKSFRITNAVWYGAGEYVQVVFPVESQEQCEAILFKLNSYNIGKLLDSSVSVLPCSIHYKGHTANSNAELSEPEVSTSESEENAWNKIVSSKNVRLTVDQIVETLKTRATLTFDFICLLLISTTICALGLVENSTVYLLSSMVMSPMMGPVMAATFGSVIRDKKLKKTGLQNCLVGLSIATFVGFCYGTITCIITDRYGSQDWPTYEITSRGELRSLWVGGIIALLSGAAVALGILSDNVASLVGVAISTSLMPPAVNAGLLWSMASVYYFKGSSATRYSSLKYQRHYAESNTVELLTLGAVSICLTLVNIICIYFAALCIFKIKEVSPLASRDKQRRQFWKYDIKNARYNNTIQREESEELRNEYEKFKNGDISKNECCREKLRHNSIDLSKGNTKSRVTWHQSTWSHTSKLKATRRLSCIFNENSGDFDYSTDPIIERNSKLIFTKSKTFVVTPCKGLPPACSKSGIIGREN
ncbi:hypothetical protein WA026_020577 [Henosepilachna vigintioctopunctata]|uniref:Uncharacterized protein n=1 Tax=Henosepilachna vigintioctopunctata TaxID=420089 RepID=A0AAW1V4T7_9CUCU